MKTSNFKQNVAIKYHVIFTLTLAQCINKYKNNFIIFTDRKSFDALDGYVRQVQAERHDNVAILIVGNKVDLQVQNIP